MKITLLIPTKNRFYYINKLLDYYSSINFEGTFIILDSSNTEIMNKIKNKISSVQNLKIKYFHFIGLPCGLMKKYFNKIETEYVVFTGDDDYFLKSGIKNCLEFLDANDDYIGCNGQGLSFYSSFKNEHIDYISHYNQAEIFGNSARERLEVQFKNYMVPIFSVDRKSVV